MTTRACRTRFPAAAVICLAAAACSSNQATPPIDAEAATASRPGVVVIDATAQQRAGVVIQPVRAVMATDRITAPGLIALDEARTARVGSLQEGLVLDIHADVGTRVRARQLLATMHGHAVHDAWAGYRKAVAERRRLQKELAYVTGARDRAQRLYASKSISLQEQQRAEVEAVATQEQLAMAEAEVVRAIEELEHIGITIDESRGDNIATATEQIPVRTPLGGVVLERLVTPGTTVTPGTPMFVVSELSSLWATAEVDESHLGRLQVGRPVDVRVAAYPDARFAGTISFIADMVNPKTRRITVRATVPNPDGRLKPEMFATVTVGESEPRRILVIPREAIQSVDGRDVVFVESGPGEFAVRPVSVGMDSEDGVEIVGGLADGEPVVVAGSFVLKSELLQRGMEGGQ